MKIYKFRPLINGTDFCRLKRIIETGEFWCSSFWALNDPMEGVFSIDYFKENEENVTNEIYGEKARYKICSFSRNAGFKNPSMWGYYAAGFKGVAIEVEIKNNSDIKRINYCDNLPHYNPKLNKNNYLDNLVVEILTTKLKAWENEHEYRKLIKDNYYPNKKIEKITAIYFGNPYGNIVNGKQVKDGGEKNSFQQYSDFKKRIIKIANTKGVSCFNVKVQGRKVVKGKKAL